MKTNNIVIVAKNNVVVVANGAEQANMKKLTGTTNTIARLKALKAILNNTPTNENYKEVEEPKLIVLESCEISGLANNRQIEF